ncbi:hypothetical protein C5N14_10665 [Micromonospora sp. MW-13]|uniref:hypothetical protein n=1 Tax=unclassified Micromonospora TaxID=2617518 RepID=UPI000E44EDAA|nr:MULTISPECIES: hypothetical protein [unclassified Micromonospora]MCX4468986.1 hypothetical protein [Micromonospora sp. NBC_01655]RGC69003.1 hypothetical protein C5N14_10665 [Micromonospora sp. MW-13]
MSSPAVRLLATTTAAASLLALAAPAQAAPAPTRPDAGAPVTNLAGTLATCYGGAVRSYFQTGSWGGEAGTYRTTSRCADVNVRNASSFGTQACVVFVDKTNSCNYWTYLPAQSGWITVATNVRDGVNFRVRFSNLRYEYEPLVAYHAF